MTGKSNFYPEMTKHHRNVCPWVEIRTASSGWTILGYGPTVLSTSPSTII